MFGVIEIPDFPLRALVRLRPSLRGEPIALLAGEGRRAVVSHCAGLVEGVSPGMTAAQALSECAGLQLLARSVAAEREAGALLMSAAWTLSPRIEPTSPGLCTVDLAGATEDTIRRQVIVLHERLRAEGLDVRFGFGPNPLVARYAALQADLDCWATDAGSFLRDLPISLLDLTEDEARLFRDLGLKTLGSLTAFPRAALAGRFGARGDELWARAAGVWNRPIQPAPFPVRHFAEIELEEPVELLEPLLFVLRRFCDRLAAEVGQFGGGTCRLALTLKLEDEKLFAREFDLPEPTARPDLLFEPMEDFLSSLHTDTSIVGLSLEVFPARRVEQQEGLFDTGLKDAPMFYATLGRLAAVVGTGEVGTPRRADTHRPDAVVLAQPAASVPERTAPAASEVGGPLLRRLRPPVPATVELTEARPSFLVSSLVRGAVAPLRRPFRANGDWWTPDPWMREEWDVQIGSGLYRLLHSPNGWFVEGIYD